MENPTPIPELENTLLAAFEILFRWGLRFRRWGRRSQVFCTWGLRISVHTQMGASFLVMQIVSTSIRSASSNYMQVDSFETDYSYEVFRS